MANTKHSAAREIIIDRLLHERRGYSLNEIWEIVNQELEFETFPPVCLNTIKNDIDNMRYLYKQTVEIERKGRKFIYRYKDSESTIFNNVLTFGEIKLIHSALINISYLDSVQGTLMNRQLSKRLSNLLDLSTSDTPFPIYENKPSENELKRFQALYEYIRTKTPAEITYSTGDNCANQVITIHPYYLHQQQAHWNLLGYDATNEAPTVLPIANIMSLATAYDIDFLHKDFHLQDFYAAHVQHI